MVAKSKRNAAHDKRHENGLAAPGKKITKQKSIPQLNGHANGKPSEPSPPLPSHVDTTEMTQHVFRSLAENMGAAIHVKVDGENDHHKTEACFKAFGRALRGAIRREGDALPSTKGVL